MSGNQKVSGAFLTIVMFLVSAEGVQGQDALTLLTDTLRELKGASTIGSKVRLEFPEKQPGLLATQISARAEITKALRAKDEMGFSELVSSGRAIHVESGTTALILDRSDQETDVSIQKTLRLLIQQDVNYKSCLRLAQDGIGTADDCEAPDPPDRARRMVQEATFYSTSVILEVRLLDGVHAGKKTWVPVANISLPDTALVALGRLASSVPPPRHIVDSEIQARLLLTRVEPGFPPLARRPGTVKFVAIIGVDGKVQRLSIIDGDPMLISAAKKAVRKWLYQPTIRDGKPVEVQTQITVEVKP